MELTLSQCILTGLWTGLCITGMLTGTYLTRCLVMAAGVGIILGDVETGLMMGAVGELAFLGFGVSSGGSVPPNPVGPGIIGAVIAITMKGQGMDTKAALAYSFPFAVLIQFLITGIYTAATGILPWAEKAVDQGNYRRFRLLAHSTFMMFVSAGFFIGFTACYQTKNLEILISAIPLWMTEGLKTAGSLLPAVGFAVILNAMAGADTMPFVLTGYILAAYMHMPVIGIALSAGAVVWLRFVPAGKKPGFGSGRTVTDYPEESAGDGRGLGRIWPETLGPDTRLSSGERSPVSQKELRRISRRTALRAYLLQNSYNYGNYEGLAYANIMFPALKKLCKDQEEFRRELKDSLGYCSINPNFLPILTSFQIVALYQGIPAKDTRDIRLALMGPLAGIGDSMVQFCFAPVFSTIGASMAAEGMMTGPVVFLLGMNLLLFGLKLFNEALGYRLSMSFTDSLKDSLAPVSQGARMIGSAVIAGLVVQCITVQTAIEFSRGEETVFALQSFLDTLLPGILPVAFTGVLFYLLRVKKWSMYRLVGVTLGAGICLKLAGILA